ncbi:hypothetical protein I6F26_06245 [Ensifer sp. IC3342]|nr:hypothetical protein [Ensifer sp. BRP08]MCA1446191.1 hypothetical protein [Ensifer sp. IC3342]
MLPIFTIRNPVGPGDETTSQIRHAVLPSGPRAEAIQKILDVLGRHLSGKEALSRDALVRLMEDLARILKFPPLPQESGRDFVKRLIGFLESMPIPERLLVERQLGGRSLAHRLAVLTAMPSGHGERTAGAHAARPQSQAKEAIRNLPVQTAAPPQFAAIKASASSDVALLQSILKKTFSADEEGAPLKAMLEGRDEMPKDARRSEAARTPDMRPQRTHASPGPDMEAAAPIAHGGSEGEVAETDAALPRTQPEGEVADTGVDATGTGNVAGETEGFDASASDPALPAGPENSEPAASDTETALLERGPTEAAGDDGLDADGTYGRPAPGPEGDGHGTQPAGPRGREPGGQAARFSAEAAKAIVHEGLVLPEILNESGALAEPRDGEIGQRLVATPSESEAAEHSPLTRPRNETTGAVPMSDPRSADEQEKTAALRSAVQAKASNPGDDPTMQQMITRLVENGLPREAIPFALVPYPPAKADAEDESGKTDRQERPGDEENDSGADAEADEGDRETHARESSGGGAAEKRDEPGAIDAYDLYRKLGGLG